MTSVTESALGVMYHQVDHYLQFLDANTLSNTHTTKSTNYTDTLNAKQLDDRWHQFKYT